MRLFRNWLKRSRDYNLMKYFIIMTYVILMIFYHSFIGVFALTISSIFSAEEIRSVKRGNIITRSYLKHNKGFNTRGDSRIILPKTQYTAALPDYEMISDEKAFMPYRLNKESKLKLYNLFLAFSRLAGMTYHPRTGGKPRLLITESTRVDPGNKWRRIQDEISPDIAAKKESYFRIVDRRFGGIVLKNEIIHDNNGFIIRNTAINPISKYGFPICKAGEYQLIYFIIYDKSPNGFYYYAIHTLKIRNTMLLKSRKLRSEDFANRLRGETVHRAKLLGLNWSGKIVP